MKKNMKKKSGHLLERPITDDREPPLLVAGHIA